ncbi:DUF7167 family protein [Virgibacillus dokdonensis]|uniref:DUF7167 domain-containing protein n=1 Tax=Virgibacillus dokdonensis TaxID=302167 RepID=A0A2K9IUK5_9BACI|nr:hypothetical protein [Virgibacillus dokdonensis]AUJ23145.1 hypothetical protein A21D_00029 [Virgibacillus dokdonensis]
MNGNTKVSFTLRIGLANCLQEDIFTLEELGYDPNIDIDLDKFLEDQWREWSMNYIDGSFRIKEANEIG